MWSSRQGTRGVDARRLLIDPFVDWLTIGARYLRNDWPADTEDRDLGLEVGESVVFRRPDGMWVGLVVLEPGLTLRLEANQRQIALERLAKHLSRDAPTDKAALSALPAADRSRYGLSPHTI